MPNTINIAQSFTDDTFAADQPIMAGDTPPMATRDVLIVAALGLIPQYTPLSFAAGAYKLWASAVAALATPVNAAFTTSATGGSLAAATYSYRVAAKNGNGSTLASTATTIATSGATSTATVNWGAVTGATGYDVFGRVGGSELLIASVGAVTTYTDTGAITPAGALPASNTTASADENIVAMTMYAIPDAAGDQRAAVATAGMFNINKVAWPAATTEDQVAAATINGQVQFRKLLYSDKRVNTSGLLVGPAYESPTTG